MRSEGSEEQAAQQVASGPSDEMTERNRRGRHLSQELLSVWNVVTTGCRAAATGGAFLYHNMHRHLQGTWSATPSTAVGQETAIVTGSGERGGIGKLVAVAVRIYRERPNSIDTHAQMYPPSGK